MTEVAEPISCQELVELVTEYLEGTLPPADLARFEAHLEICPYCVTYVEQLRETVRLSGALREEQLEPAARDELLAAFRNWKNSA
jgi:anti-sigma factor RsiW